MVTSWNGRLRYMRFMVTKSGNSATHGAHHVAHTLTTSSFFVSFLASLPAASSSMGSNLTGSLSHCSSDRLASSRLSAHFVEQPNTRVFATGTGTPDSNASTALRASWDFTS